MSMVTLQEFAGYLRTDFDEEDAYSQDIKRIARQLAAAGWHNPAGADSEDSADHRVRWNTPGMKLTRAEIRALAAYKARPLWSIPAQPAPAGVWRRVPAEDGMGGRDSAWAPAGLVRRRIPALDAVERTVADQAGARLRSVVWLAVKADVRRGDQLREIEDQQGRRPYLVVLSVSEPPDAFYRRAVCQLVQPEVS